jgi:hypothetical protein
VAVEAHRLGQPFGLEALRYLRRVLRLILVLLHTMIYHLRRTRLIAAMALEPTRHLMEVTLPRRTTKLDRPPKQDPFDAFTGFINQCFRIYENSPS